MCRKEPLGQAELLRGSSHGGGEHPEPEVPDGHGDGCFKLEMFGANVRKETADTGCSRGGQFSELEVPDGHGAGCFVHGVSVKEREMISAFQSGGSTDGRSEKCFVQWSLFCSILHNFMQHVHAGATKRKAAVIKQHSTKPKMEFL